jgi:hypothetical protein
MFTDKIQPGRHGAWQILPDMFSNSGSNRLKAKRYKLLPHLMFPRAKYWLWIDGSTSINIDPMKLINDYGHNDLTIYKHPSRNCLYREHKICIRKRLDKKATIRRQIKKYKQEGYPKKNGLVAASVILRKNTRKVVEFNKMWWNEVKENSIRDQLSFNYVAWKLKFKYGLFEGNIFKSDIFPYHGHEKNYETKTTQ